MCSFSVLMSISASIGSPGTSVGMLLGSFEGSLEGPQAVFIDYWSLFGCSSRASSGYLGASLGALAQNIDIYDGLAPGRKPVRARTGSELLRQRMLSRRIEKRSATDSEQMRQ